MDNLKQSWVKMSPKDIDLVNEIADEIHTSLPEKPEVFLEKINIYPNGCWKLVDGNITVGYGIAHPWLIYDVPPLDEFLVKLPADPTCMYIHDVAVLPRARGAGAAEKYLEKIIAEANKLKVRKLACVSVYGTDILWQRYGFKTVNEERISKKLSGYGSSAKYMISQIHDQTDT